MRSVVKFSMIVSGAFVVASKMFWGGGGLVASAALSGGRFMTPAESLEVFGSEIGFSYFNGTDYADSTFRYSSAVTVSSVDNSAEFSTDLTSYTYLRYISDTVSGISYNYNYITVDIAPSYSIFDTEQIHSCIALSTLYPVSTAYQSPAWDWVVAGQSIHSENPVESSTGSGVFAGLELYSTKYTFVPFDFISQSTTSGYSLRATFNGNNAIGNTFYLLIACPYISTQAEGSNGTFATTSTSGNVDLSETNGLLGGIVQILNDIHDSLFGDPEEPAEPEEIETAPDMDYHKALDDAAEIVDDVPTITAAAGFWFAIYRRFTDALPLIGVIVPLGAVLSLISYALWK